MYRKRKPFPLPPRPRVVNAWGGDIDAFPVVGEGGLATFGVNGGDADDALETCRIGDASDALVANGGHDHGPLASGVVHSLLEGRDRRTRSLG